MKIHASFCGGVLLCMMALVLPAQQQQQQPVLSDLSATSVQGNDPLQEARRMVDAKQYMTAEGALRVYLQQNDLSSEAHELLAYALLRQNKPRESLAEYTRAASLHTPSSALLINVAQDYVLLNDYDDAGKWLLRAVEMQPKDADAWYNLGRLRYSQQRFDDARLCFEHVLALSPRNVKAEDNRGRALEVLGQVDKAKLAYRQAIAWQEMGPKSGRSEQPLVDLATVLLHENKMEEAEPLLLEAVDLAPGDSRIHEQLGHMYMQLARYADAEKEFARASQLAPKESGLHFLLGQAYKHEGKQTQADEQFAIAARMSAPKADPVPRR